MAVNRIAAGRLSKHTRLLEVRCGLCVTVLIFGGARTRSAGNTCPLVVCIGWRMGGGAPIMCRSTARSTVAARRQWAHKRARHRRGAGRANKAKWRTEFAPRGRCADIAGAVRAV